MDVFKLFAWENSLEAIEQLENLLQCSICKEIANDAKCLGRCDHFFCAKCVKTIQNGICPKCSIPAPPCEMQPDRIIANLVSSAKDLRHILNGGHINCIEQGLEAPAESCTPKSQMRPSKPLQDIITEPKGNILHKSAVKKEIESGCTVPDQTKPPKELNSSKAKSKAKPLPKPILKKVNSSNNVTPGPSVNKSITKVHNDLKMNPVTPEGKKIINVSNLSALGMSPGGPSINKRNSKGETMLHIACIKGECDKVKMLLADGANPNSKDNAGWTPLHEACSHGFYTIAEMLLQHGAIVDVPGGENDENPLHDAVTQGQLEVVKLLRCWGACDSTRNRNGHTPRSLAHLCMGSQDLLAALDTPIDTSIKKPPIMQPFLEKMVLLGSGLGASQTKSLDQFSKMLRGRMVSDFSQDVSHIVADCTPEKVVCQRTPKYLMGVVSGKWIVSHTWLDECFAQGLGLNPEAYEVCGSRTNSSSDTPRRARINASKMRPGLFSGCHFYLWGIFREPFRNKKTLEALIKAGNGIVLAREPNPESENVRTVPYHADTKSVLGNCSYIILYQEGAMEPQMKYNMDHIKTLPLSWFIDCIESFAILTPVK